MSSVAAFLDAHVGSMEQLRNITDVLTREEQEERRKTAQVTVVDNKLFQHYYFLHPHQLLT